MMLFIRSLLFNIFLVLWTLVLGATVIFVPFMRVDFTWKIARIWVKTVMLALRWIIGLTYEVKGVENIPDSAAVFACKHQSAWETIALNLLVDRPAFVLKRSLLVIPFFGQYLQKLDMIAIDRSSGAEALKILQRKALQLTNSGRPIIIFPEGTRTKPGTHRKYKKRGVTTLYAKLAVPLVPVALNSGLFWPRNSFIKYPGKITIQFLPAIPPGLENEKFMATLQEAIETASDNLLQMHL